MADQNPNYQRFVDVDLAATHKRLAPKPDRDTPEIAADFETLMRQGYVILEGLISPEDCAAIKREGERLLGQTGRNAFEGLSTQRVYALLSKTRTTDRLADHPRILGLMDRLFLPGFLLSQSQIINILPGEDAQLLHADDSFYRFPRPRPALGAAAIWAIDDFTDENGATRLIPGSHEWGDDRVGDEAQTIAAEMPAGSAIFFLGTLWHGGGANRSGAPRMAVTHQYCEAYMRQQENYLLELDKPTVRALSPELRALVGYSIFPPFMGMVDGKHPLRLLETD